MLFLVVVVMFSFVSISQVIGWEVWVSQSRDWLGRLSLKWSMMCRVGC